MIHTAIEYRRWLITGRVQGVFFRASTRETARSLDLAGEARNLDDGRVQVVAIGAADALDRLAAWLETGPSQARVRQVEEVERRAADEGEREAGFRTA